MSTIPSKRRKAKAAAAKRRRRPPMKSIARKMQKDPGMLAAAIVLSKDWQNY